MLALPLQIWSQIKVYGANDWRTVIVRSSGGLVGLVPEGLVLLTSVAFLLAAVNLSRQQVLVQELPAVEGLARVDVVCLDKTGTLTVGDIVYDSCRPVAGRASTAEVESALGALADDPNRNGTLNARAGALPAPDAAQCAVAAQGTVDQAVGQLCWQPSTATTVALLISSFWILVVLARPFRPWKLALLGVCALIAVGAFTIPLAQDFFQFRAPAAMVWQSIGVGAVGALLIEGVYRLQPEMHQRGGKDQASRTAALTPPQGASRHVV